MAYVLVAAGFLNRDARALAAASTLAAQKIEELRAIPVGDPELAPSPRSTLDEDVSGYFDETDGYVRRWSIAVMPAGPPGALLFQVVVFPARGWRSPVATLRGVVRLIAV